MTTELTTAVALELFKERAAQTVDKRIYRGSFIAEDIRALSTSDIADEAKLILAHRDADRDMLEDARAELDVLREALGVAIEPHQTIHERLLETAKRIIEGAERYRFLRTVDPDAELPTVLKHSTDSWGNWRYTVLLDNELDTAIDAARKEKNDGL